MTDKKQANTHQKYIITEKDLPLSCPMDSMRVWDSHPKVFLPIEETGKVVCPYCDAEFVMKGCEDAPAAKLLD